MDAPKFFPGQDRRTPIAASPLVPHSTQTAGSSSSQ